VQRPERTRLGPSEIGVSSSPDRDHAVQNRHPSERSDGACPTRLALTRATPSAAVVRPRQRPRIRGPSARVTRALPDRDRPFVDNALVGVGTTGRGNSARGTKVDRRPRSDLRPRLAGEYAPSEPRADARGHVVGEISRSAIACDPPYAAPRQRATEGQGHGRPDVVTRPEARASRRRSSLYFR
jgi:hypothetical protein